MHYFAFIRRDDSGHYVAQLPDFPGRSARAATLAGLQSAVRRAVRSVARASGWPAPTAQVALPRLPGELDGFWMQFEVPDAAGHAPAAPEPVTARADAAPEPSVGAAGEGPA